MIFLLIVNDYIRWALGLTINDMMSKRPKFPTACAVAILFMMLINGNKFFY